MTYSNPENLIHFVNGGMTTPNNTRDVTGEDSAQDNDPIHNQPRFQHLTAIASMHGTPDIFLTITSNTSRLDASGPGVDTE
jgi:hypothetical protein